MSSKGNTVLISKVVKMPISIVKFSDLALDKRFEAEYYHPARMRVLEILRKTNFEIIPLGDIVTVRREMIDPQEYYDTAFNYVELKNVPFAGFGTIFTRVFGKSLDSAKLRFKKGDILFSKIRTYLNKVVFIPEYIEEGICSTEFVVLKVNKNKFSPPALWVYLVSKYAYDQVRFIGIGSTRPRANPDDILNIRVPLLPRDLQQRIDNLVHYAFNNLKTAEQKYQQAEDLLYQLLGISKEEIKKLEAEKAYETNFKEVREAFRFDAEYYHPKYLGVIELLKKTPFNLKPLKEVVEISSETMDPTKESYKTKKFRYVPIAKINESGEIFEWDEFYGWQAPSRARMVIRKGDIIIPSLTGTFDKIALVPEELNGQLATTGCFIIRAKNDYPEFLFLLFRSPLFKRQLEQQTTGAIMSAVPKTVFGNLLIPDIPKDQQEEIANLVREYFKLRKEARQLVQIAIKEVEEVIENASRSNGE